LNRSAGARVVAAIEAGRKVEIVICHREIDDPIDPECPLTIFRIDNEIPDVVLVSQTPWTDEALCPLTSPIDVCQTNLAPVDR